MLRVIAKITFHQRQHAGIAGGFLILREDFEHHHAEAQFLRDGDSVMNADQRRALFENTARSIGPAPKEIQIRHIRNCLKADPAYGKGVAEALRIPLSEAAA
jgi:catalase